MEGEKKFIGIIDLLKTPEGAKRANDALRSLDAASSSVVYHAQTFILEYNETGGVDITALKHALDMHDTASKRLMAAIAGAPDPIG